MTVDPLLLEVLDAVEEREMRLLSWGVVDTGMALSELSELIDPLLDRRLNEGGCPHNAADEVIAAMRAAGLLHASRDGRVRSRLAETLRLLQRLRQIFPDPRQPTRGDWEGAPTLVADFRISRRPRRYPKRDRELGALLSELVAGGVPEVTTSALQALASGDPGLLKLAAFQCRATQRILGSLRRSAQAATMVCAGTGSGKTLAFYLPVLSHLAELVSPQDAGHWVKAIALYPRNELLKDQLAEVYGQCRQLDDLQRSRRARKLTVAAYFGPAPRDASDQALRDAGWKRGPDGYLCDYVRCPRRCAAPLCWFDADRRQGRERLRCASCGATVQDDEVRLTRRRIEQDPPDVLFASTEMLNRRLSDSRARHLFGIGLPAPRAPRAVLLDEAHTYHGNHGAQVAYLMRRWRVLVDAPFTWVGLSATLRDAAAFFRDLTGLAEGEVAEVSPLPDEHESEGAEYMVALRGDPASRTSLLSTTIQAVMLLARVQDARNAPRSDGAYGTRTFVFTDDIDVTNRLYFDLLDAEGRDSFGRVDSARPHGGLATLRAPQPGDRRRYDHGQDWQLVKDIGHDVETRLLVGRTSSQDAGVDLTADVIVATASLEVGFNDPAVGAVVQHKAPRDAAQYLQRKGRAGRSRKTRPFTVVVLSDHGRDRATYQNYQTLFDPLLPPRRLPIRNRNVLRMQAVYSTIDFLRQQLAVPGHVWTALAGPSAYASVRSLQGPLEQLLTSLLRDPAQADVLRRHLRASLHVDEDELDALLWDYPRPLLLAALPTALRRLADGWAGAHGPGTDVVVRDNPLPDFVPASLFSDLNLPEITIDAPPQTRGGSPEQYAMPLLQAMRQFAPGRVSRRFGIVHRRVRHWLPLRPEAIAIGELDLDGLGRFSPLGRFDLRSDDGAVQALPVHMPRRLIVERPPVQIGDSSNAQLVWHTQIVPAEEAVVLSPPATIGSGMFLAAIEAFTHQTLNPLEVRRFATATRARLRYVDGRDETVTARFVLGQERDPVAMGFSLLVDGIRFRLREVPSLWDEPAGHDSAKWRALRIQRYRDEIASGHVLSDVDYFLRIRLGDIFLVASCRRALRKQIPLESALAEIAADETLVELKTVLEMTLQAAITEGATRSGRQEVLRHEVEMALGLPIVRDALYEAAAVLWRHIDADWQPWLRRVYRETLGAAIADAVIAMCPGVDESQLVLDTDPGPRMGHPGLVPDDEVWLTETSVGGGGIVEQFVASYAADPRRFTAMLDRSLDSGEWEQVDAQLRRLAVSLQDGTIPAVAQAMERFRIADRADEADLAFAALRHELALQGFPQYHAFLSALANRMLRPGSSAVGDSFLAWALQEWEAAEQRLGVELDLATVAPLFADRDEASAVVEHLPPDPTTDLTAWRTSVVTSMLWPRGAALRSGRLESWNPYRASPVVEPWLVNELLSETRGVVDLEEAGWQARVLALVSSRGHATAIVPATRRDVVAELCRLLATTAVEHDYLVVYARVRAVRLEGVRLEIDAEVAEVSGGAAP